jgi:hypothetical protein
MESQTQVVDAWGMTIGLLGSLSGDTCPDLPSASRRKAVSRHNTDRPVVGLTVRVVERSTATRLTLSWRDPSRCAYCDQEWFRTRARRNGVCAVTGRAIQRGEDVYRPRAMRPRALNADMMIHCIVLDETP